MAARRGKTQARRSGSGGGTPGWVWLLVGLLLGGLLFLGAQLWFARGGEQPTPQPNPDAQAPAASEAPVAQQPEQPRKPKYDFYTLLPEKEVLIPDAELEATVQAEANRPDAATVTTATDPATPATTPPAGGGERYVLQAGAFRAAGDAEALKARLALSGLQARVEPASINGATVYRVRMGPYPSASELAAAKAKLTSNGVSALAIRAR